MKKKSIGLCASGIIVNDQKQVLIVKRSDADDFLPGYWELPGGGMEYGEQPDASVKREVLEECGVAVNSVLPLYVKSYVGYTDTPREKQYVEIFYICEPETADPEVTISFEHSDYQWVMIDDVHEMYMTDYIKDIFTDLKKHPLFLS